MLGNEPAQFGKGRMKKGQQWYLVSRLLHLEGGIRNRAVVHLAGCLPYTELILLPGVGHVPQTQVIAEVARVILENDGK